LDSFGFPAPPRGLGDRKNEVFFEGVAAVFEDNSLILSILPSKSVAQKNLQNSFPHSNFAV
jgi:hypothetical protein